MKADYKTLKQNTKLLRETFPDLTKNGQYL